MASKNQISEPDVNSWARRTSARLRLIHASFADEEPDRRRTHLEDEILFALDDAGSSSGPQRDKLLRGLANCFPQFAEAAGTAHEPEPHCAAPRNALDDLVAEWRSGDAPRRAAILARLTEEGVIEVRPEESEQRSALPDELRSRIAVPERVEEIRDLSRALDMLWRELGESDPTKLPEASLNRVMKLLGILCSSLKEMHNLLWEFWRNSAPRDIQSQMTSSLTESFEQTVAKYVSGSSEVGSRELAIEMKKMQNLLAGLCVGLRKGAEEFGRNHYQVFAVENIENAVVMEETAPTREKVRDLGRKSWEKYSKLSKNMTPDALDSEFHRVFSNIVAAWCRSRD